MPEKLFILQVEISVYKLWQGFSTTPAYICAQLLTFYETNPILDGFGFVPIHLRTNEKEKEIPSLPKTPKEISFTGQKEGPRERPTNQLVLEIPREKLSLKPLPSKLLSVNEYEESPYNRMGLSPESGYAGGSALLNENSMEIWRV